MAFRSFISKQSNVKLCTNLVNNLIRPTSNEAKRGFSIASRTNLRLTAGLLTFAHLFWAHQFRNFRFIFVFCTARSTLIQSRQMSKSLKHRIIDSFHRFRFALSDYFTFQAFEGYRMEDYYSAMMLFTFFCLFCWIMYIEYYGFSQGADINRIPTKSN